MEHREEDESHKEAEPKETRKYSISEIFEYLEKGVYPAGADKNYKHGLRKRSKFFMHEAGRLFYNGGQKKGESLTGKRLVIANEEERKRITRSIHDEGHLGRDKTLAQINSRYYWPNMYKEICTYVRLYFRSYVESFLLSDRFL